MLHLKRQFLLWLQTNTLLVVDIDSVLVGEVSVTDLLDAIVPDYLDDDSIAAHFASDNMFTEAITDIANQQVKFFMDTQLYSVVENENIMTVALYAMAHKRARIPVVDTHNRPIGIISRRGIKHIIADILDTSEAK